MGALIPLAIELVPMIARWIAGDKGEAVGKQVADVVTAVTGVSDEVAAAKLARENPGLRAQITVQLAQIEAQMYAQAREVEKARIDSQIATLKVMVEDTQSARQRDLEFLKSGRRNVRADLMLAIVVIGLIACTLGVIFLGEGIGIAAMTFVTTIGGGLLACVKDAFSFEFGSSRQSENKTQIIADMAAQAAPVAQAFRPEWQRVTDLLKK